MEVSGQCIDTGENSPVVDHVEFVAHEDGGRHFRSPVESPSELGSFQTFIAKGKNFGLHEAGGKVNDISNFKINKIDIKAANPNIYEKMIKKLTNF